MDPFSMMLGAASIGMQAFGAFGQSSAASKKADAEKQIAADEMQQDQVRRTGMELDANRKSMEQLRNTQRMRAMATNAAVGEGAQFGSGLQGGLSGVSAQGDVNMLGIRQNLSLGENMFDLNAKISQQKMNIADAGADMAKAQAWSSLGKSLGGAMGPLSSLSKGFSFGSPSDGGGGKGGG